MTHLGRADWEESEKVQNLVDSYSQRYGPNFWQALLKLTGPENRETIADFGCGPGLFLVDAVQQYKANKVYGFDMNKEMLKYAAKFLQTKLKPDSFVLEEVDFDEGIIPIKQNSLDLSFSGYMLHEVQNPKQFTAEVFRTAKVNGTFTILDFISGNPEAFKHIMSKRGMPLEKARKRYPHMCKHSLSDLLDIVKGAGFSRVNHLKLDEIRAIVQGIKRTTEEVDIDDTNRDE